MSRRQLLTLIATIIGSGIVIIDSTVVNLALPHIASNLHASFTDLQWIVDGYMLTFSALILLGGSLGDVFGRKKIYLLSLTGFGVFSLFCGLAPNPLTLIIMRILQGAFGALLVPGGLAIINTNFEPKKRGAAIGRWAAWSAIFAPLGPILGGYLLTIVSWRWIFFINLPLLVICYALAAKNIEESRDTKDRHLDISGALLAMLGLASLIYGLIQGPANHWQLASWLTLLVGLLLSAWFVRVERHSKDPMVRFDLFRSHNFTGANLMTFMMYGALSGFLFALIIYLQTAVGFSSFQAGISILPLPIAIFLLSSRFGALSARMGPRLFMTIGPVLVGIGIFLLYPLTKGASYLLDILPGMVLFGFGMSLLVAPLTVTVMGSVADTHSGIASGINNAVSRVAGLVVVALLGIAGEDQVYPFAIILCGSMSILAGVISYFAIQSSKTIKTSV